MQSDYFTGIHRFLVENSQKYFPALKDLLISNGTIEMPSLQGESLYIFLVKTVIGQQLSKQAANSIFSHVISSAEEVALPLRTFLAGGYEEKIRKCGVSSAKTRAIKEVTIAFGNRSNFEKHLCQLSYHETTNELTKIWGVGKWTADMASIFHLNHEDVWCHQDSSLSKGIKALAQKPVLTTQEIENILFPFSPYKSFIALHIWRGLDSKKL